MPAGKSLSNRLLLLAALAHGTSRLQGLARCDDTYWCQRALQRLGVAIQWPADGDLAEVVGGLARAAQPAVYLGASGTLARFLPGLLAARAAGAPVRLQASRQLSRRPMAPLLDALRALGATIATAAGGRLPWRVEAGGLHGGEVAVDDRLSTQFVSSLILAAVAARGPCRIRSASAQAPYVRMTVRAAQAFGANILVDGDALIVRPEKLVAREVVLPGDVQVAGPLMALAAAMGRRLVLANLPADDDQGGDVLLAALAKLGCQVARGAGTLAVTGPPQLAAGGVVDLDGCGEQLPTVAALAALAAGPTRICGAARARGHESDRVGAMAAGLRLVGAGAQEHDDGLTVTPPAGGRLVAATVPTFADHRIAMAWAVVGAAAGGITLADAACVAKSCPTFFALMAQAGVRCQAVAGEPDGGGTAPGPAADPTSSRHRPG